MALITPTADFNGIMDKTGRWLKWLHMNPELGNMDGPRERNTQAYIQSILTEHAVPHITVAGTGTVAIVEGKTNKSGRNIGIRADIDALPIQEANTEDCSNSPGVMHACGHDGHTASGLASAILLSLDNDFDGTAYIIFQPGEEGHGGARAVLSDPAYQKLNVQRVVALHAAPFYKAGIVQVKEGPLMYSADFFNGEITFPGGHVGEKFDAARQGMDPVAAMGEVQSRFTALQNAFASHRQIIQITNVHTDTSPENGNTIPSRITFKGTTRATTPEMRDSIQKGLENAVSSIHQKLQKSGIEGFDLSFNYNRIADPLINDRDTIQICRDALSGNIKMEEGIVHGYADDIAAYPNSALLFVGINDGTPGSAEKLHTSSFRYPRSALPNFVGITMAVTKQALQQS